MSAAEARPGGGGGGHAGAFHGGGDHGGGYHGGGYHGGGYYGGGYHGGYYRGGSRYWGPGPWVTGIGIGLGVGAIGYYGGYYGNYYAPYNDVYYDNYEPGYVVSSPAPMVVDPSSNQRVVRSGQAVPAAGRAPEPIFYGKGGQSAAKTESDRQECNRWAATQQGSLNDASVFQRATFACMEGRGYIVK